MIMTLFFFKISQQHSLPSFFGRKTTDFALSVRYRWIPFIVDMFSISNFSDYFGSARYWNELIERVRWASNSTLRLTVDIRPDISSRRLKKG